MSDESDSSSDGRYIESRIIYAFCRLHISLRIDEFTVIICIDSIRRYFDDEFTHFVPALCCLERSSFVPVEESDSDDDKDCSSDDVLETTFDPLEESDIRCRSEIISHRYKERVKDYCPDDNDVEIVMQDIYR